MYVNASPDRPQPRRCARGCWLGFFALLTTLEAPAAWDPDNNCSWRNGIAGPTHFIRNLEISYIGANAPLFATIGAPERYEATRSIEGTVVECIRYNGPDPEFQARLSTTIAARQIPRINGRHADGKVLDTNIPGVGIIVRLGPPVDGSAPNYFIADDRDPRVPFTAWIRHPTIVAAIFQRGVAWVTLVKTGPIAFGTHLLDKEIWHGHFTDLGVAVHYRVQGSVVVTGCDVRTAFVSQDPVPLGEWPSSHFTHEASVTDPVDFSIRTGTCVDNPDPDEGTYAYITLEGVDGSLPLDAENGIFSLNNASSAQGLGIQILRGDGTPIALQRPVRLERIPHSADLQLDFKARYYQTAPSVRAGTANGTLNFTLAFE